MFRVVEGEVQCFLAHPGGPDEVGIHAGAWSIPKGETEPGESLMQTALREFHEEVGLKVEATVFFDLGWIQQKSAKVVHAWAFEGSWEAHRKLKSFSFEMEWPPESGRIRSFTEVDQVEFFPLAEARRKIKYTQRPFIDRLEKILRLGDESNRFSKHH